MIETNVGKTEVVVGPMYSGKTSTLIDRYRSTQLLRPAVSFKPSKDTRYSKTDIVSHSKEKHCPKDCSNYENNHCHETEHWIQKRIPSIPFKDLNEVGKYLSEQYSEVRDIFIDELHFLPTDAYRWFEKWNKLGINVFVVGLNWNYFTNEPFKTTANILAIASVVSCLTAECEYGNAELKCKLPAVKTEWILVDLPKEDKDYVGGKEKYKSFCLGHYASIESERKSKLVHDNIMNINLYERYKDSPTKLKIVCDWDEVIQACEPYAGWKAFKELSHLFKGGFHKTFEEQFKDFWDTDLVEYTPYGSKIGEINFHGKEHLDKYEEIKNSPTFYQQAPFLTIAEDLLKLIKEDKVEKLIFLSAYDKRKFPHGDPRKIEIFNQTFGGLKLPNTIGGSDKIMKVVRAFSSLELIGFDSENQGQTKADWINQHVFDFDLVIDDNPNICRNILNNRSFGLCRDCRKKAMLKKGEEMRTRVKTCAKCPKEFSIVCSPHYLSVENQHDDRVFLIKNEVSDLKKEDFGLTSY